MGKAAEQTVDVNWDVFLSHNSLDKDVVEQIARRLRDRAGLRPFLDNWHLRKGDPWQEGLETALASSSACAVFIGPSGFGPWQNEEMRAALNRRVQRGDFRVIPVLLPGAADDTLARLPEFLSRLTAADLRPGVDGDEFEGLVAAVRGEAPGDPRNPFSPGGRRSWEHYDWLFQIREFQLAYLPLLNFPSMKVIERTPADLRAEGEDRPYELPPEFARMLVRRKFVNNPSCRLSAYKLEQSNTLSLRFSRTTYEDYLKSGEHLDQPSPDNKRTFRDVFGGLIREGARNLRPFRLSNICGVGLFVRTRDEQIVASWHSTKSHVYPGRLTFAASGVMRWTPNPDPFSQMVRRAWEELNYHIALPALRLIAFGADARKLYFQFGFVEKWPLSAAAFRAACNGANRFKEVSLEPDAVAKDIVSNCWEPAAEACLLTICASEYGWPAVIAALENRKGAWQQRNMRDEWDYRAWAPGALPDMSVRYPSRKLWLGSRRYLSRVTRFLAESVNLKRSRVVEVGAGTGRVTSILVNRVRELSVVDLCPRMIELNRSRLGADASNVKAYIEGFAQQALSGKRYDLAISCLVLIHNVAQDEFETLVQALCAAAPVVVVCEDVTVDRPTSPRTQIRSKETIQSEFARNGFDFTKGADFPLFEDKLWLARFEKRNQRGRSSPVSMASSGADGPLLHSPTEVESSLDSPNQVRPKRRPHRR